MITAITIVSAVFAVPPPKDYDARPILDAVRYVETGSVADPNNAVGDNGKALGAYQIWYAYWLDAVEYDPSLKARGYQAVTDQAYAEKIVIAYWSRYAKVWDEQTLARIHNGGPSGAKKKCTLPYWTAVKEAICNAGRE